MQSRGHLLGIGTHIGEADCKSFEVTVFDLSSFGAVGGLAEVSPVMVKPFQSSVRLRRPVQSQSEGSIHVELPSISGVTSVTPRSVT